jgi:hypothetical protein
MGDEVNNTIPFSNLMDFYIDDIFTKYDLTDTQKKIKKK